MECLEAQAEEVSRIVEEVMVEIINPGLDDLHPDRAPVGWGSRAAEAGSNNVRRDHRERALPIGGKAK